MVKRDDLPEFCGQLIDEFEDFLEARHIMLLNSERDDDPDAAIIYGSDYDDLCAAIVHILDSWLLLEKPIGERSAMVEKLAEDYGTHDLLTAYIMRTAGTTEGCATDILYELDTDLERWIDELLEDEEEDECENDM